MFHRFTSSARRAVVLAQEDARGLGHDHVGTEHLLLGLAREDAGGAARVLASLGVTPDAVRQQVVEILGRGEAPGTGQLAFTPRVKKVLELALRESVSLGHSWIGTEHLLLGLTREGQGIGNRILRDLGSDGERIRSEVVALLEAGGAQPS